MIVHAIPLLAALLAEPTAPRVAGPSVPFYDPYAYCRRLASLGGNYSEEMMQGCLQQEQSSYDQIKAQWATLESSMQSYCDRLATLGGQGSYEMLLGCVDQERQAQRSNKDFQFQR